MVFKAILVIEMHFLILKILHLLLLKDNINQQDFGTWRIFVFDPQTGNADQVPVLTDGKSQAFANPSMTMTTWKGQPILIVTLFVPSEQSAPGEAGELIYYHKL